MIRGRVSRELEARQMAASGVRSWPLNGSGKRGVSPRKRVPDRGPAKPSEGVPAPTGSTANGYVERSARRTARLTPSAPFWVGQHWATTQEYCCFSMGSRSALHGPASASRLMKAILSAVETFAGHSEGHRAGRPRQSVRAWEDPSRRRQRARHAGWFKTADASRNGAERCRRCRDARLRERPPLA